MKTLKAIYHWLDQNPPETQPLLAVLVAIPSAIVGAGIVVLIFGL